ncbi:MAG: dihydrolipoyl dehydrogenase [Candidatus Omnitrophica bacterium]|nr:dihydrolipoyl dehydrogenase [Candidatus Omnitrophota bacterium]
MNRYDVAIIGSGPCGYVAAIRAAQLGLKVSVFERERIGGVCLNWGCIPTKALSVSSMALYNIERANEVGVNVKDYELDFSKVCERKDKIVKKLTSGIEMLMKARKIEIIKENAQIKDNTHIVAGTTEVEAKNILIATGSVPFEIPGMAFDSTHILSSTDMLKLQAIPKSIIIVGGGVIGCEFASIFRTFGSKITIVEMMSQLLPNEDGEIARKLEQVFRKRGIDIFTGTKVERIEKDAGGIKAVLSNGETLSGEKTLICVGRSPNSKGLGIENISLECDRGWIKVDKHFRTNINNIYAAGDVKGGILLAHVASREGMVCVETMSGKEESLDYSVVPNCIFTYPEIASVGLTEKSAKEKGINMRARKFLFSAIGKAHVIGETEGFIKLVVDNDTDKILGSQIIGAHATELIAEFSPCIQFGITSENLASVIHAHPTLSEVVQEVSEAVHDRAIHSL